MDSCEGGFHGKWEGSAEQILGGNWEGEDCGCIVNGGPSDGILAVSLSNV